MPSARKNPHIQTLFTLAAGAPDITKDPEAWNTFWEELSSDEERSRASNELTLQNGLPGQNKEMMLLFLRSNSRSLVDYQRVLSDAYRPDIFEPRWKKLSSEERRKHMLEGLIRCMIVEPEAEADRNYCSELVLDKMNRDNGQPFLDLARRYISQDPLQLTPKTPLTFPHPRWADEMRQEQERDKNGMKSIFWEMVQLSRDLYFCRFICGVFGSVTGVPRPPPQHSVKPTMANRQAHRNVMDDVFSQFGNLMDESTLKQAKKEWKDDNKVAKRQCEYCCKMEDPKDPLKECQRCRDRVDRRINYCNADCQTKDWPKHKKICGKPLTADLAKEISLPDSNDRYLPPMLKTRFGPANEGTIRSEALKNQISCLNMRQNYHVDYFFFSPASAAEDDRMKVYPLIIDPETNLFLKKSFRCALNEGVEKGIEHAIVQVAQFLVRRGGKLAQCNLSTQQILKQVKEEFPSVDLDRGIRELDEAIGRSTTALELTSVVEMKKRTKTG